MNGRGEAAADSFRRLFESEEEAGLAVLDAEGRIRAASAVLEKLCANGPAPGPGRDPSLLFAEASQEAVRQIITIALAGPPAPPAVEAQLSGADQPSDAAVEVHCRPVRGEAGALLRVLDITARKDVEEQQALSTAKIETAMMGTVRAIAQMVELRDPYTAGHERRVADLAVAIATEMGMDTEALRGLRVIGQLHDIGKIAVPAEILARPGRLNPSEMEIVRGHAQAGHDILHDIDFPWPVADAILQHHERIDGSGYPQGLKDSAILDEARILAVADTVEAMSSHRPYRSGLGIVRALEEIEAGAGRIYCPEAAAACLRLFREKGYVIPD